MEQVTRNPVWRDALALSKAIVEMCEDFSNQESNVLLWHLRNSVVDIPATIASDFAGHKSVSSESIFRLRTLIELIHGVYPAIETASVIDKLDILVQRIETTSSQEQ